MLPSLTWTLRRWTAGRATGRWVLEMEHVSGINTLLRTKTFWADPDGVQSGAGFVEPCCLATALYEAITTKKHITLVGL